MLRSARLSRASADRLLDGGRGPEPLRHLLTVAAGPGQWDELRGEEAARLAFIASAGNRTAPDAGGHRGREAARTLSRIMAAKAIAVVALTVGAGSVAVAATTNSFGAGPLGASTRQQSEPAGTDSRSRLVVDQLSGRAAADLSPLPGSCQDGAEAGCGVPNTAVPPSPPNQPTAGPVQDTPAGLPSTTDHPSPRRPSSPPGLANEKKNPRAGHGSADDDTAKNTAKKQPPGQAVKESGQADENAKPAAADED